MFKSWEVIGFVLFVFAIVASGIAMQVLDNRLSGGEVAEAETEPIANTNGTDRAEHPSTSQRKRRKHGR